MSTRTASTADEPPQEDDNHQSSLFFSLPNDIVLNCLARVPRLYYLNLSYVSKTLRSLVRSPELNRLRPLFDKDCVYICFKQFDYQWFNLRRMTTGYQLVRTLFPSRDFMYFCSIVELGSESYFIGGDSLPSTDLWILDTRSGQLRNGPSIEVARCGPAMAVVEGKIYVIEGCKEEIQVEVFDPKSQNWEFAKEEKVRINALSPEKMVYILELENEKTVVYNPRQGMIGNCVCMVENVLYGCFQFGLMWFDTKLNEWKRLATHGEKALSPFLFHAMAEYDGKLAVFRLCDTGYPTNSVWFGLILLDRVGDEIVGTYEWSGIVAHVLWHSRFLHCLAV